MLHLSRSCLVLAARGRALQKASLHTTSILSTDRFSGSIKDQPDPDQGKKFSPADYRQSAGQGVPKAGDDFFDRNEKLKRPMSPHLGIYQMQLPMLLSGTHRLSGFLLGLGLGLTSLGILIAPHDFQHYVNALRHLHLNEYLLMTIKFTAAWLLSYHYLNGVRHLFWDAGKGFQLPQLYRSGYAVVILSILAAAYLTSL